MTIHVQENTQGSFPQNSIARSYQKCCDHILLIYVAVSRLGSVGDEHRIQSGWCGETQSREK